MLIPCFCDTYAMYKLYQLNLKKELMFLIAAKHKHTCTKEPKLLSSRRFSKTFLNFIYLFIYNGRNEKKMINLVSINTDLVLRSLMCSF